MRAAVGLFGLVLLTLTTALWLDSGGHTGQFLPPRSELPRGDVSASTTDAMPLSTARRKSLGQARLELPLSFVANGGQWDSHVRYAAQGQGFGFFFTDRRLVLGFPGERGNGSQLEAPLPDAEGPGVIGQAARQSSLALELRFLGAAPGARLRADRRAPGRVSYLLGSDPRGWQRGLPTFARLSYHGLWPGIDMSFQGSGGRLKYEFALAPGADPARIALAYGGAEGLAVGRGGELRIATARGTMTDAAPRAWQWVGGRRVPVQARYALRRSRAGALAYGFALGAYDRSRPVVIDPALGYSSFLGGASHDQGNGIAVDGSGNAYVIGRTFSEDFPATPGAFDTTYAPADDPRSDVFVAKLNPAGSALVYTTYLGGPDTDEGNGIAVDGSGHAYLAGRAGAGFPTTAGAYDTARGGLFDGFVAKLSPDGSALAYSSYLGGAQFDGANDVAIDASGNAYATGITLSDDFPTTSGAYNAVPQHEDVFVVKLDASGSALVYSTTLGVAASEGNAIAVDGSGSTYLTGGGLLVDFPTTPGAPDTTRGGFSEGFVTKLNSAGSALVYSTYLGGSAIGHPFFLPEAGHDIALDASGGAYVTGVTDSDDFPTTPGAFDTSFDGTGGTDLDRDAFVTKLTSTGSLAYSTYLGGDGHDLGYGIAVDPTGRAHVTGEASEDFPTTPGAVSPPRAGDAFVSRLNPTGSALGYSTHLGGAQGGDRGLGIALNAVGSAYVTGVTDSDDFPTTPGAFDTSFGGSPSGDAFVAKLVFGGRVSARGTVNGTSLASPVSVAFSAANNCRAAVSTGPFIVQWGSQRFTKSSVTRSDCRDDPAVTPNPPLTSGFDTQVGTANGTLQNGQTATLEWSFVDGGEGSSPNDRVRLLVRNNIGMTVLSVTAQAPRPLSGTPGGVWTAASE